MKHSIQKISTRLGVGLVLVLGAPLARAETYTWTGSAGTDWFTAGNWEDSLQQPGVPGTGDSALVPGGTLWLTNQTDELAAFTMTGGTLSFSNWTTRLRADDVVLDGESILTLPPAFAENQMSNRVWIVCGNDFYLGTNALIDTLGRGFAQESGPGATPPPPNNYISMTSGAGYGGRGGHSRRGEFGDPGAPYGSTNAPLAPGSGGILNTTYGQKLNTGGGAVRIEAINRITLDGVISAEGGTDTHGYVSGGSGGAIYLSCATFAGSSNALLNARGGSVDFTHNYQAGGGGGGRIAVDYQQVDPDCAVRFTARRGMSWIEYLVAREDNNWWCAPEHGTLWLPDLALLPATLTQPRFDGVRLYVGTGLDHWEADTLSLARNDVTLAQPGFRLFVTNSATIGPAARLTLGAANESPETRFTAASLALTDGGTLEIYSGEGDAQGFGARLSVSNTLTIGVDSELIPVAHSYDGGIVRSSMKNLSVAAGGGVNADGRGYAYNYGPGTATKAYTGAGYGGRGGVRTPRGDQLGGEGLPYGSVSQPRGPGSGGLSIWYGRAYGGGAIWMEVAETATIDGTLRAVGGFWDHTYVGGGSGGAVYLDCATFAGDATGFVTVEGGSSGYYCPGGGGRIAVDYNQLAAGTAVRFAAAPGESPHAAHTAYDGHWWWLAAQDGTLWLPDGELLTETLSDERFMDLRLVIDGLSDWPAAAIDWRDVSLALETAAGAPVPVEVTGSLALDNATLGGVAALTCGGGITLTNGAHLAVTNAVIAGDLDLLDGAAFTVHAAATNGVDSPHGALVQVSGTISLAENSWIYPASNPTNGGAPRFRAVNVLVDETSGFNADSRGFAGGYGPGHSPSATTGAGHGGHGGRSWASTTFGEAYGTPYAPVQPGSGTALSYQYGIARGGGVIWVEAAETLRIDGSLRADGGAVKENPAYAHSYPGGGAGGGVFLVARRFRGENAAVHAQGGIAGPTYGGGGGGGRIALLKRNGLVTLDELLAGTLPRGVQTVAEPFGLLAATFSADAGTGWADGTASTDPEEYAQDGSVRFLEGPADGTLFIIR